MKRARIIPVLLFRENGLYKTTRFKDPVYIGDAINTARVFNEKQCDELIILDIEASRNGKEINYNRIAEFASECFMPLSYGGGISNLEQIEKILRIGIEKVILNTGILTNPNLIKEAYKVFGSSTIVASVDIKKNLTGQYRVFSFAGRKPSLNDPVKWMKQLEHSGAGEIMLTFADRDGTNSGYDISYIQKIAGEVSVPLIACGGCRDFDDIRKLFTETKASAAAAGNFFVFHGKHKAVLITYPDPEIIDSFSRDLYSIKID